MCGITAIFNIREGASALRQQALEMSKRIRHRGPDWSGIYQGKTAILAHERLSIVDPASGGQPLKSRDGKLILTVNGEIYNHRKIREELKGEYEFMTGSDCEVILALYRKYGTGCVERLSGIFAFALYDEENDTYLIARDPIGVIPLYMGYDDHGHLLVSSELKGLEGFATIYDQFKPGHYFYSKDTDLTKWYIRDWMDYENVKDNPASIEELHDALEAAVQRQLMSDVPYGVLLSGGLDSSITSAIAKKYAAKRIETGGKADAWWPQLHSFAIGLKGAPDLIAARKVADAIGTVHHEINYTIQEGLDALRDVIYYIETYDVTTVRASTPMYLLSRVIKSMGIKMVLSGEGADEVFGGYLYFHKAPDAKAFHEETLRKISKLYLFACQQKPLCLGCGRPCSLPRQRISRRCHAPEPGCQNVSGQDCREEDPPRSLCRYAARRDRLASERTVLRRRWLQLDRYIEKDHFRTDHRRRDETSRRPFSDQYAAKQGRILLPYDL